MLSNMTNQLPPTPKIMSPLPQQKNANLCNWFMPPSSDQSFNMENWWQQQRFVQNSPPFLPFPFGARQPYQGNFFQQRGATSNESKSKGEPNEIQLKCAQKSANVDANKSESKGEANKVQAKRASKSAKMDGDGKSKKHMTKKPKIEQISTNK